VLLEQIGQTLARVVSVQGRDGVADVFLIS
jgi:hypothetical protein